jgi:hypothetical protein
LSAISSFFADFSLVKVSLAFCLALLPDFWFLIEAITSGLVSCSVLSLGSETSLNSTTHKEVPTGTTLKLPFSVEKALFTIKGGMSPVLSQPQSRQSGCT